MLYKKEWVSKLKGFPKRVGIGYDIHALKKGRKLVLGGVLIPHTHGLLGHSDGDVLWHAIVDAILGAMAEGDIGEHFGDTDSRWKGASSLLFVKKVRTLLKKKKLRVHQVDSTLILQSPRLGPFKQKMQQAIAKGLGIKSGCVGVKAKTHEKIGPIGQKRAIACIAIVSLKKV